ncbi:MAG TPA: NUDIX domain-containing protein [Candidatus Paceibacterota bacterium]
MTEETKIPKVAINVLVVKNGKVLMGRKIGVGKVGYGTWCFPGGKLDFGESLMEGAKRELLEETGIKVSALEFSNIIDEPRASGGTHYLHINFLAKAWEGEPVVTEPDRFEKWEWFDLDSLPEETFVSHKRFIPAYLRKIVLEDGTPQ